MDFEYKLIPADPKLLKRRFSAVPKEFYKRILDDFENSEEEAVEVETENIPITISAFLSALRTNAHGYSNIIVVGRTRKSEEGMKETHIYLLRRDKNDARAQ